MVEREGGKDWDIKNEAIKEKRENDVCDKRYE
jgi:hypothetical protein